MRERRAYLDLRFDVFDPIHRVPVGSAQNQDIFLGLHAKFFVEILIINAVERIEDGDYGAFAAATRCEDIHLLPPLASRYRLEECFVVHTEGQSGVVGQVGLGKDRNRSEAGDLGQYRLLFVGAACQ